MTGLAGDLLFAFAVYAVLVAPLLVSAGFIGRRFV